MLSKHALNLISAVSLGVGFSNASLLNLANDTPSASQAANAISAANLSGNSPIVQALNYLANDTSALTQVLSDVLGGVLTGVSNLLNPELQYSYGQSPPVYPSPEAPGTGSWAEAYDQARALVAQLTSDEKNLLVYGASDTVGCSGFITNITRVGFPGLCLNDAENGVRDAQNVNGYSAQLSVGAAFNRSLAYERALYMGREFKGKGINLVNGPVIGPIGRLATNGRNWEGFGSDPYLAGELVGPTVSALQESVIACVKHFLAYEQETNRLPFLAGYIEELGTQSVSSNLDDRTMHEVYLWPFYDAVRAGAGSVMASYNRVNNSYASQNSKILNGLLKTELGFEGFVTSDWTGQHTGIASANAGLDVAMPNSLFWNNNNLVNAVNNGSMTAQRLDDMVTRILAPWYRYANFETPGLSNFADTDVRNAAADSILLSGAIEGHVLVKNVEKTLPLSKPKVLSIFGFDAIGGQNSSSDEFAWSYGETNTNKYDNGFPWGDLSIALFFAETQAYSSRGPQAAFAGTLLAGGGSGAITPTTSVSPYDALLQQAAVDGTTLYTDFTSLNPTVNQSSDACLVFINEQAAESWDRSGLADANADTLVNNVAAKCAKTIVTIHNAGTRVVDSWIDNANVAAVIFAHTPGQESGNAIVELLYGRQSPSGRLPYTVAKNASDYGDLLNPTGPTLQNSQFPQSNFTEGVNIDYKYFIQQNIEPRFAFGYGLTYSSFSYADLQISKNSSTNTSPYPPDRLSNTTQVAPEGGLDSLYDIVATVSAEITNTGGVAAAEVAQLYVGIPNGPPRVLRGFEKKLLQPNQTETFEFALRRRDLSSWDAVEQQWLLASGSYAVMVGKSVLDAQLNGTIDF